MALISAGINNSQLKLEFIKECKRSILVIFHSVSECFKVTEMATSADGNAVDLPSPQISYKDYLELWEFLLQKDKFKVSVFTTESFLLLIFSLVSSGNG